MTFYGAMAVLQVAALLGVAYWALPHSKLDVSSYPLVIKLLWLQASHGPKLRYVGRGLERVQAARRYAFVPKLEVVIPVLIVWLWRASNRRALAN